MTADYEEANFIGYGCFRFWETAAGGTKARQEIRDLPSHLLSDVPPLLRSITSQLLSGFLKQTQMHISWWPARVIRQNQTRGWRKQPTGSWGALIQPSPLRTKVKYVCGFLPFFLLFSPRHQLGCQGRTSPWWTKMTLESLQQTTGSSSDSSRPLPRRLPPRCRGAWPTFTCTCGFSSGCWWSCWRCSSSPCTGWRTSSPPLPPSPTAAARRAAPSPTWRSAASPLSAPLSPHYPPEGAKAHMGEYGITAQTQSA